MPVLVIVTVCAAGCVYGVCKEPKSVKVDALIEYVVTAVTAKLALTAALALLLPLMVMVSLYVPTANPAFGRTVNVAVASAARVVVESVPIS